MKDETFHMTRTDARSEDDQPNEFGYTCTGAAIALADMFPFRPAEIEKALGQRLAQDEERVRNGIWEREYKFWANQIFKALKAGELKAGNPFNGSFYEPETFRIFYDRISADDLNRWIEQRGVAFRLNDVAAAAPAVIKVQTLRAQEQAILKTIEELGYTPKALPVAPKGKPGVKSCVMNALKDDALFTGATTFKKAWERLSGFKDVAYKK